MGKYRVYLNAVASTVVEVEAEDRESAIDAAYEGGLPYASAYSGFDLGDWELPSDSSQWAKPEDDVEEIDE